MNCPIGKEGALAADGVWVVGQNHRTLAEGCGLCWELITDGSGLRTAEVCTASHSYFVESSQGGSFYFRVKELKHNLGENVIFNLRLVRAQALSSAASGAADYWRKG